MEDGRTDAEVARDRCLRAMVESQDLETRRSLWRAALKYDRKNREGAAVLKRRAPAGHAHSGGRSGRVG